MPDRLVMASNRADIGSPTPASRIDMQCDMLNSKTLPMEKSRCNGRSRETIQRCSSSGAFILIRRKQSLDKENKGYNTSGITKRLVIEHVNQASNNEPYFSGEHGRRLSL